MTSVWDHPVVSWSHTVKNQVSMQSDTLYRIQCTVPLITRVTWRQALQCNVATSLVSMPGCYFLMTETVSCGCHNRTKCSEGCGMVNKCSRALWAQKQITWRHQGCHCIAAVLPTPQQVFCRGAMCSLYIKRFRVHPVMLVTIYM
jgi:hypothetical protein